MGDEEDEPLVEASSPAGASNHDETDQDETDQVETDKPSGSNDDDIPVSVAPPPTSIPETLNLASDQRRAESFVQGSIPVPGMPDVPPECFVSQAEVMEGLEEERASENELKKEKRIVSQSLKELKETVLKSLRMAEDSEVSNLSTINFLFCLISLFSLSK